SSDVCSSDLAARLPRRLLGFQDLRSLSRFHGPFEVNVLPGASVSPEVQRSKILKAQETSWSAGCGFMWMSTWSRQPPPTSQAPSGLTSTPVMIPAAAGPRFGKAAGPGLRVGAGEEP